ncbi:unnamed protein product [Strongylus vulgaris]|uniref:Uncharacterized protein n=1 Tax=Strongylus vulgaris TaxID=40348 RepID=A0A3P7J029_STRVU|nr:unnamed protein product [Strongylus vulgaris]
MAIAACGGLSTIECLNLSAFSFAQSFEKLNPLTHTDRGCVRSISVRVSVNTEKVEYDVSPWCGMEDEQLKYKQSMDQLIPVLYDILGYLSGGFHIELTLSFVSTKSLPFVI